MNEEMMVLQATCPFCEAKRFVEVPKAGFMTWRLGATNIQDAMPTVSASDREALLTGICGECFPSG